MTVERPPDQEQAREDSTPRRQQTQQQSKRFRRTPHANNCRLQRHSHQRHGQAQNHHHHVMVSPSFVPSIYPPASPSVAYDIPHGRHDGPFTPAATPQCYNPSVAYYSEYQSSPYDHGGYPQAHLFSPAYYGVQSMMDGMTMTTITSTSAGVASSTLSAELEHESTPAAAPDTMPDLGERVLASGGGMDEGDDEVKDNATTPASSTAMHGRSSQEQEEQPQIVVLRHAMEGLALTARDTSDMTSDEGVQDGHTAGPIGVQTEPCSDYYDPTQYEALHYQQQYYSPYGMDGYMTGYSQGGDMHFDESGPQYTASYPEPYPPSPFVTGPPSGYAYPPYMTITPGYDHHQYQQQQSMPARFFVIKSFSEEDVCKSLEHQVWASTELGNRRLDNAYRASMTRDGHQHTAIYLLFSVNGSSQFCGVAQMLSPVDFNSDFAGWAQAQKHMWRGYFRIKWMMVKDVPNAHLRHITLSNNNGKPLTNSRDTQEIPPRQGYEALEVMRCYPSSTSLWDRVPAERPKSTPIVTSSLNSGGRYADEDVVRHKKRSSKQQDGLFTSNVRRGRGNWYGQGTRQDDEREASKSTARHNNARPDHQQHHSADSGDGDDEGSQTHSASASQQPAHAGPPGDMGAHEAETDDWAGDRSRTESLRRERRRMKYVARQARKKAQALMGDAHDGAATKISMTDKREGVEDPTAVANNQTAQVFTKDETKQDQQPSLEQAAEQRVLAN